MFYPWISGIPYEDKDKSTHHPSTSGSSPLKRRRPAGTLVPTNTQAFVVTENNVHNFRKCLSKLEEREKLIAQKLDEEMRRITDALSASDSDDDLTIIN